MTLEENLNKRQMCLVTQISSTIKQQNRMCLVEMRTQSACWIHSPLKNRPASLVETTIGKNCNFPKWKTLRSSSGAGCIFEPLADCYWVHRFLFEAHYDWSATEVGFSTVASSASLWNKSANVYWLHQCGESKYKSFVAIRCSFAVVGSMEPANEKGEGRRLWCPSTSRIPLDGVYLTGRDFPSFVNKLRKRMFPSRYWFLVIFICLAWIRLNSRRAGSWHRCFIDIDWIP